MRRRGQVMTRLERQTDPGSSDTTGLAGPTDLRRPQTNLRRSPLNDVQPEDRVATAPGGSADATHDTPARTNQSADGTYESADGTYRRRDGTDAEANEAPEGAGGSDAASAAENGSAARQDETAADENVFGDQLTR